MAGPLNGIGGQQIPFATSFQPGQQQQQSAQVRPQQEGRTPKPNQIEQPNSPAGQTQKTEARNTRDLQSLLREAEATGERGRGSVVDLTV